VGWLKTGLVALALVDRTAEATEAGTENADTIGAEDWEMNGDSTAEGADAAGTENADTAGADDADTALEVNAAGALTLTLDADALTDAAEAEGKAMDVSLPVVAGTAAHTKVLPQGVMAQAPVSHIAKEVPMQA
ncbi:hypothetical protein HWV62_6037, partial [Athelia sp. TMB]